MIALTESRCLCTVGGCDKIRPLWRHYYTGCHAIWFWVDSNDVERISGSDGSAAFELSRIAMEDGLDDVGSVVILCNKQDLPGALSCEEITQRLGLANRPLRWPHVVLPACATRGEGLWEALAWTIDTLRNQGRSDPRAVRPFPLMLFSVLCSCCSCCSCCWSSGVDCPLILRLSRRTGRAASAATPGRPPRNVAAVVGCGRRT